MPVTTFTQRDRHGMIFFPEAKHRTPSTRYISGLFFSTASAYFVAGFTAVVVGDSFIDSRTSVLHGAGNE